MLERASGNPIVASVKAWPNSEPTGSDGDCGLYGVKPLASAVSDAGGTFELQIDADQKTYTVVYCANGYTTYVGRDLPNLGDGEPTMPIPVFLRLKASQQTGAADFEGDVVRTALSALNELAYLRSIDSERYDSAISDYASLIKGTDGNRAELFLSLANATASWGK